MYPLSRQTKGYLYAMLAAMIFGSMPIFAKYIYANGGDAPSLAFYRNVLALPPLYYLAFLGKNRAPRYRFTPKEGIQLVLLTGLGLSMTVILLFGAYSYVPSGLASTVHFVYPVLVILGAVVIYRDPFSWLKLGCVLLCTVGVVCFYTPGDRGALLGVVLAFTSGVTFAFYSLYLEKSGLMAVPRPQLMFYSILVCSVVTLVYALWQGGLAYEMPPQVWLVTIGFAWLVSMGAVKCFQEGVALIGAQKTAIFNTFEPVTSIILGALVFKEHLTLRSGLGVVLVLSAVVILTAFGSKEGVDKGKTCDKIVQ